MADRPSHLRRSAAGLMAAARKPVLLLPAAATRAAEMTPPRVLSKVALVTKSARAGVCSRNCTSEYPDNTLGITLTIF